MGPDAEAELSSFDEFFTKHRDEIAAAVAVTISNGHLAAEATDEAMVRALVRWDEVSTMRSPTGWVYAVALNWSRGVFRRRRREELGVDPTVAGRHMDAPQDVDLYEAIQKLPQKGRAVVVLRHLLGFTVEETAEALKIAPGTVKSRLARSLDKLRIELEDS